MPDEPDPIAYTALQPGTPVHTSDGHPFATVQAVLVDEKVSVFDGIVVQLAEDTRFVDADLIGSIYTTHVRTTLSAEQAANLPTARGVDPGRHQAVAVDGRPVGPHVRSREALGTAGGIRHIGRSRRASPTGFPRAPDGCPQAAAWRLSIERTFDIIRV